MVDDADAAGEVADVEQVAVGDDQVGDLAGFQRADFAVQARQPGGGQGGGMQRLGGFHACLHEQFQFAQLSIRLAWDTAESPELLQRIEIAALHAVRP